MDLGIVGKRAIVCASSKGLGRGCAMALAREGVEQGVAEVLGRPLRRRELVAQVGHRVSAAVASPASRTTQAPPLSTSAAAAGALLWCGPIRTGRPAAAGSSTEWIP